MSVEVQAALLVEAIAAMIEELAPEHLPSWVAEVLDAQADEAPTVDAPEQTDDWPRCPSCGSAEVFVEDHPLEYCGDCFAEWVAEAPQDAHESTPMAPNSTAPTFLLVGGSV